MPSFSGPDRFGPLQGLRILDFSQPLAGPFGAQVLADVGAEVVKVEPPRGDGARRAPTLRPADLEWRRSGRFQSVNRNPRRIVVDLTSTERAKAARRLALGFAATAAGAR
jgi:crotonobetainyl-CoA:carnitine CoA-transferase CaiB-like acyl-CoA transferase